MAEKKIASPGTDGQDDQGLREIEKVPTFLAEARKTIGRIGRPPKDVNEGDVELLASFFAPKSVVARRLGISVDTLNRRFLEAYLRGLDTAKIEVWFAQFVSAVIRGNVKMLVHLGVNHLGQKTGYQKDDAGDEVDPDLYTGREPEDLSREELMAIARMGLKKAKPKGNNGKKLDSATSGERNTVTGRGGGEPDQFH